MTEVLLFLGLGFLLLSGGRPGAQSRVETGYIDGQAYQLPLVSIGDDQWLRQDAAAAFQQMRAAAVAAGVTLDVNESFRTWAQQAAFYAKWLAGAGARAAAPGYSKHQSGVALDIETAGGTNAAFAWLSNNAARFGFVRTVSDEPWHWEYA